MYSRGWKPPTRTHDTTNKSEPKDIKYDSLCDWTRLRDDSQWWGFVWVALNLNSSYQSVRCVPTAAHTFVSQIKPSPFCENMEYTRYLLGGGGELHTERGEVL